MTAEKFLDHARLCRLCNAGGLMRRLDASGLTCPLPVLKARKVLLGMAVGDRLEIITTDPLSVVDMPVFCAQAGHRIVTEDKKEQSFVFVIERGAQ